MKKLLLLSFVLCFGLLAHPQSPTPNAPASAHQGPAASAPPALKPDSADTLESLRQKVNTLEAKLKDQEGLILFLKQQILEKDKENATCSMKTANLLAESINGREPKLTNEIEAYKASLKPAPAPK